MTEEALYPEYHLLVTPICTYPVSAVMVAHVQRQLERWPRPRWVTFVDLAGAYVRVRANAIQGIEHSSPETRALRRRVIEQWIKEEEEESPDE